VNKSYQKRCKKCKSDKIKKDWFKRWKQRYKCKLCGHIFQNKTKKQKIDINELWNKYCFRKQTYAELAKDYWVTVKTIQKYLDKYEFKISKIRLNCKKCVAEMIKFYHVREIKWVSLFSLFLALYED